MTIVTNQLANAAENKENDLNKLKAAGFLPIDTAPPVSPRQPSLAWQGEDIMPMLELQALLARRRRRLSTLCIALLALWLLLAGLVGGILLFRYLHRPPVYYGWCGTDYLEKGRVQHLRERVEINEAAGIEKIEVPQFGFNRPALFVHDFKQNLTAIVDVAGEQCFLKRLDPNVTAPPRNFIDLVRKMEEGYYDEKTSVVRQDFVVSRALSRQDVVSLGSWMISMQCRRKLSFWLRRVHTEPEYRVKRSIVDTDDAPYASLAMGGKLVNLYIHH